jgi:arylsulfatase A-like enzyme
MFYEPRPMGSQRAPGISRRRFAKLATVGAAAGLAPRWARASSSTQPQAARARPNFLVILADDLGWGDLSCYGAPSIRTPNLDKLAASGMRFTNGYSASAICSPTRFGLYTGRYPGRLAGGLQEPIRGPKERDGIPLDHPTLATLLKGQGYQTSLIGKWHCGFLPWFSPTRLGWDEFFGNFAGGVDYFSKLNGTGDYDLYEGEVQFQDLRYYTDILMERAGAFLQRKHRAPWLLNLNFTAPHWPWESREDKALSDKLTARMKGGEKGVLGHFDGGSLATYQKMVEQLDDAIGKVLGALRRSGQAENTVVFFASDNGGERFSYNWPFSGGKGTVLEGGIRVPTILSWPGKLKPRQVSAQPVVTMDWTATFIALAGAQPDPEFLLDGHSLMETLLRGSTLPPRDLFWRMAGERALRRGDLKYVRLNDGVDRLTDLGSDVREQANLARERPKDLAALRSAWEAIDKTLLPYPS